MAPGGWPGRLFVAGIEASRGYSRHGSSQFAAAISYRVLFSLVPLVALIVSVVDLVMPEGKRQEIIDWLLSAVPGPSELDESVERAVSGAGISASLTGLVALIGLLWAASGMMASIRAAFRVIWDAERGLSYVEGKLFDFVLVLAAGVLAVLAFAAGLLVQTISTLGKDISTLTGLGAGGQAVAVLSEASVTFALTFAVFLLLYRSVPPQRARFAALWPAALLASIAFNIATTVYGLYLTNFSDFNAIYGTLGALLGFLVVNYVGAMVILGGAELVHAWPPRDEEEPA